MEAAGVEPTNPGLGLPALCFQRLQRVTYLRPAEASQHLDRMRPADLRMDLWRAGASMARCAPIRRCYDRSTLV